MIWPIRLLTLTLCKRSDAWCQVWTCSHSCEVYPSLQVGTRDKLDPDSWIRTSRQGRSGPTLREPFALRRLKPLIWVGRGLDSQGEGKASEWDEEAAGMGLIFGGRKLIHDSCWNINGSCMILTLEPGEA